MNRLILFIVSFLGKLEDTVVPHHFLIESFSNEKHYAIKNKHYALYYRTLGHSGFRDYGIQTLRRLGKFEEHF